MVPAPPLALPLIPWTPWTNHIALTNVTPLPSALSWVGLISSSIAWGRVGQLLDRCIRPHSQRSAHPRVGASPGNCGQGGGSGREEVEPPFLGHVSPASCPGAQPRHCAATVCHGVKLGPAAQSFWSGSQVLRALCRWPLRTQDMADGAQANPKGFRKKMPVRHPVAGRGASLRTQAPSRTSRYVPASLGWIPGWREQGWGQRIRFS